MSIVPYDYVAPPPGRLGSLDVSFRVSTPNGWMELNYGCYELHRDTLGVSQRAMRRTQTSNPFVPGQFTVNAVVDTVTEIVSVWVTGDTHFEMEAAVDALVGALEQPSFLIERRVTDSLRLWWCFAADVTISTQAEYLYARKALVQAQVPRLPQEQKGLA
jgi:hypothetical protein